MTEVLRFIEITLSWMDKPFHSQWAQKLTLSNLSKIEMYEVVRIVSIIIFHLSTERDEKPSSSLVLCVMYHIFLVRLQGRFEIDHSWKRKACVFGNPVSIATLFTVGCTRFFYPKLSRDHFWSLEVNIFRNTPDTCSLWEKYNSMTKSIFYCAADNLALMLHDEKCFVGQPGLEIPERIDLSVSAIFTKHSETATGKNSLEKTTTPRTSAATEDNRFSLVRC